MSVNHKCALYVEAREGFPKTEVTRCCEAPCGCWELYPGPQKGQQLLLSTEPALCLSL